MSLQNITKPAIQVTLRLVCKKFQVIVNAHLFTPQFTTSQALTPELFSHLYTVGREYPHILTNSPNEAISLHLDLLTGFGKFAGFLASCRPLYRPCSLAMALLSFFFSSITLRSKVAMAVNMIVAPLPG